VSEPAARERRWTEQDLLDDVAAGPQGPAVGAFLDVGGTLIDGHSLGALARHHLRAGHVAPADLARVLLVGLRGGPGEEDVERLFELGLRAWAGRTEDELVELGERMWRRAVAGSLHPEAWRLVAAHRRAGPVGAARAHEQPLGGAAPRPGRGRPRYHVRAVRQHAHRGAVRRAQVDGGERVDDGHGHRSPGGTAAGGAGRARARTSAVRRRSHQPPGRDGTRRSRSRPCS